jgi:hypothetical protein
LDVDAPTERAVIKHRDFVAAFNLDPAAAKEAADSSVAL